MDIILDKLTPQTHSHYSQAIHSEVTVCKNPGILKKSRKCRNSVACFRWVGYHLPWFFYQGSAIGVIFLSHRIFNFGLALWGSPAARIVAAICVTAKTCTLGQKSGTACSRSAEKLAVSDARCSMGCGRGVKSLSLVGSYHIQGFQDWCTYTRNNLCLESSSRYETPSRKREDQNAKILCSFLNSFQGRKEAHSNAVSQKWYFL